MRRLFYILSGVVLLAACSNERKQPPESQRDMDEMLDSWSNEGSVGRYQFYPPSGDMPAILLDTATGCVERFVKLTSLDNEKQVTWARVYLDGTIPDVVDNGTETKAIPNSGPPERCKKPRKKEP